MTDKINVLILTTNPKSLESSIQFLKRRNVDVTISSDLQQGISHASHNPTDWVFLSVNLSVTIDKYIYLLKSSLNIDPILFGDVLDRNTVVRLSQSTCPTLSSAISGPNIMMKIHQVSGEKRQRELAATQFSSETAATKRRKGFGFIHIKESRKAPSVQVFDDRVKAKETSVIQLPIGTRPLPKPPPLPVISSSTKKMQSALRVVSQSMEEDEMPFADFRPVQRVDSIDVMVLVGEEMSGYLLIGSSLQQDRAKEAALKLRESMSPWIGADKGVQEQLFGTLKVSVDSLPQWAEERSSAVCRFASGDGEVLTCFLPDPKPLPLFHTDPSSMVEVRLHDIPIDVVLPCTMYLWLPANKKYVCLFRENGKLSASHRDRLHKKGVSHLLINKDDLSTFSLSYVRERLFRTESTAMAQAA